MNDTSAPLFAPTDVTSLLQGCVRLGHLGVIRAQGEDAAKFLHGQLTQDFSLVGMDQARLAAFCNAKGRMQASFIGFKRSTSEVLLVCSRDLLDFALKRLSMFVLRAKVKLSNASEAYALYGLSGSSTRNACTSPWVVSHEADVSFVNLYPAFGLPRQLMLAAADSPAPALPSMPLDWWLWADVRSGVATLSQPLFEAFVPQMLNYESVGGVNFKKGCYPGQEVVARSQFRGTLKRRAHIFHSEAVMQAGQEIFNSQDAEQPAGVVVQAAASPAGGCDAIVSLQLSALEAGTLHLASASGSLLTPLELPYPLLEDI